MQVPWGLALEEIPWAPPPRWPGMCVVPLRVRSQLLFGASLSAELAQE